MVTFPHGADQPMNSDLLVDAGCGLKLSNSAAQAQFDSSNMEHTSTRFLTPIFTSEDFYERFKRILTEESFKLNVCKLRVAAKSAGGKEKSVNIIQNAYIHYLAAKPI